MYNQNQPYMINTFHVTSDWDGFVETYHPGQMPLCVAEAIHRAQVSKTLDAPVTTDYPIRPDPLDDYALLILSQSLLRLSEGFTLCCLH